MVAYVSGNGHLEGPTIFEVAPGIHAVDLLERGRGQVTSGYLIAAERPAIVDPGAAHSAPIWLEALAALGISPAEIAYVIVTHIHLDHAGGAGMLLRHLQRAQVVVHRNGARHLVDPSRLVASARGVFGENLEAYFGLPEPVAEPRLLVPEDGSELDLGAGHRLRFYDAFGHARHQHMILDTGSGSLFSGDEFGKRVVAIADDYLLPETVPTQFDPEAMGRSADLLLTLRPEAVLFAHFGRCPLSAEAISRRLREQVPAFVALGRADGQALSWEQVRARLVGHVRRDLAARGIAWTPAVEHELAEEMAVWSQGIADYHERRRRGG